MIRYNIEISTIIRGEMTEIHYIESEKSLTREEIFEMVKSGDYFQEESFLNYDVEDYLEDSIKITEEGECSDKT